MSILPVKEFFYGQKLQTVLSRLSFHSKTGLRKITLESDVKAMQKKIEFFRNDLGRDPTPLKTWRENLRLIRSQNDMDKAVPQPPLFPILEFQEGELIWQLSDDNLEDDNVNWQNEEEATVAATYL